MAAAALIGKCQPKFKLSTRGLQTIK